LLTLLLLPFDIGDAPLEEREGGRKKNKNRKEGLVTKIGPSYLCIFFALLFFTSFTI
jgi:hypothetical protein